MPDRELPALWEGALQEQEQAELHRAPGRRDKAPGRRRRVPPPTPGARLDVTVKLTAWQKAALAATGQPASRWIRAAVEQRLRREVPGYAADRQRPGAG